jgi:homoserine dehydrogenase
VTRVLDEQGVSIKSFVQRGRGAGGDGAGAGQLATAAPDTEREDMRLVMVVHPLAESRLRVAIEHLRELDFVRAPPRAIRVIEEEFG